MNMHMADRAGKSERTDGVVDIGIKRERRDIGLRAKGLALGSALVVASSAALNYKLLGLDGSAFLSDNKLYYDMALMAGGTALLLSGSSVLNMVGNNRIVNALRNRGKVAFTIAAGSALGSMILNAPKESLLGGSPGRLAGYAVTAATVALAAANVATLPVFLKRVKEARRA